MDENRYATSSQRMDGGFGSVVEIFDRYLGRDLLYKEMHDLANNEQLATEVAALTRIRSRHIIEIYDIDHDPNGNLRGLIIEKLQGRDYSTFYLDAANNSSEYLRVIYQISCAIADLHSANIIHRDLKLENFKSSSAGIIKLFDFGIASVDGTQATSENRGTLVYAAPELFQQGAVITRASDVYAIGICCWKLATSSLPSELLERPPQQTGAAPSIATVASYLPPALIRLIDACVAPDPALRPSAADLVRMIGKLLLKGLHRGLFFTQRRSIYELSVDKPSVRIALPLGELRAAYSGTEFTVTSTLGDVFINNQPATAGMELLDACVLTFGDFSMGRERDFISFFCSKPEIVL